MVSRICGTFKFL